jgi:hypothetical protein
MCSRGINISYTLIINEGKRFVLLKTLKHLREVERQVFMIFKNIC